MTAVWTGERRLSGCSIGELEALAKAEWPIHSPAIRRLVQTMARVKSLLEALPH